MIIVLVVVGAAGDFDSFSCNYSPANSPFLLITAPTIRDGDIERPGSNFGDCIDIFAPGDQILSPYIGDSNTEEAYLSGSSASSAVVTGMIGIILNIINSNHTVIVEDQEIQLYKSLKEIIIDDYPILLRNILLSTKHYIFNTVPTRDSHPDVVNLCDLRNIESVHNIAKEYHRKLKTKDKSSPISRVKNNFMTHQKKKLAAMYDE